ncbi:MAG TPA: hypothetical protein VGQ57_17505, partial [Polyangiaceae bacterium]|nr:hypothetical protein [Polyangiaceae bacterium]
SFEATAGDVRDGVEPFFIVRRKDQKTVASGALRTVEATLEVEYALLDPTLDDADFERIFALVYLDVFTDHYFLNKLGPRFSRVFVRLSNRGSAFTTTVPYPDPE